MQNPVESNIGVGITQTNYMTRSPLKAGPDLIHFDRQFLQSGYRMKEPI
jgi:hypothetical protein